MAGLQQNGGKFSYIPLNDLKLYTGPPVHWKVVPDILQAHKIVRSSGVPNFLNAIIPVVTQLNPNRWQYHLRHYWDKQLTDFIRYGFPLDCDRKHKLKSTYDNHTLAIEYKDHIDQFIQEELHFGALYGPFDELPFPVHVSSLMTRAKQNSDKRCTIMDLSWPKGSSVHNAIHKFKYLDTYLLYYIRP